MFLCLFFHSVTSTGSFFLMLAVCFSVCLTDALCLSHTNLSHHKPYFAAGFVAILYWRHTKCAKNKSNSQHSWLLIMTSSNLLNVLNLERQRSNKIPLVIMPLCYVRTSHQCDYSNTTRRQHWGCQHKRKSHFRGREKQYIVKGKLWKTLEKHALMNCAQQSSDIYSESKKVSF